MNSGTCSSGKRSGGFALAFLLAALSLQCAGPDRDGALRIAMIPKLVGIGYFEATERGAREAARELNVELVYDGPTDARTEDQIKMIDGWMAQGFDVIAVAPNDPEAISRTLRSAGERGALVLTWDTDANPELSRRSVFVNQAPNRAIGHTLVDLMAEGVRAQGASLPGDYLIVSGTPTASNQNTWMKYMRERIREKYPEMHLLQHLTPGEDQQKCQEQTAEALSAYPDLKGIWGITSVSFPAVAKAVRDANKVGQIEVTGLGMPEQMREFVKDGTVREFCLWDPVDLGYLTVRVAHRLKQGPLPPGRYDFGRLKQVEVREGEVLLGPPLIFDGGNIDDYNF
jgi:ABC-type sugar transport system substrate-binding protein